MKKVVVLTGAGVSAESGIDTFRDSGGVWEKHDVREVATPEAFERDPELVLKFYNERRRKIREVEPNKAHKAIARLEEGYDVTVVTQNIDNLHERAGSSNVIHIHGSIFKARSTKDPNLIYDIEEDIKMGDTCEKGGQLRPHVVWFGEPVPMMQKAGAVTAEADILLVVGTSLVVYPAAGLIHYVDHEAPKYVVDPNMPDVSRVPNVHPIEKKATEGAPPLVEELLEKAPS
jgi:NAD-dependent deacetylase